MKYVKKWFCVDFYKYNGFQIGFSFIISNRVKCEIRFLYWAVYIRIGYYAG